MNKKKVMLMIIIIFVSIALVASVGIYLLDASAKINQGNFRINDFVIESRINVIEKDAQEVKDLSSLIFDISQINKITILIANQAEAKSMYIDNIYISNPLKAGKLYMTQNNYEEKFELENMDSQINIYPAQTDGQYRIELNVNNENCIQDVNVSSGSRSIRYDGTILSLLNTRVSDLRFDVSFDLNIIDITGKKNVCKMKVAMPDDELLTNGISVLRQDVGDFVFSIK